ncbi:unnamed protein product [Gongylonema pulchrum]|uniref:Uncharacterized protein n=1 Tax=Gongylonema pulchrum TaxID=637853 RepID=A0A183EMI4_9BILA|nr:unnamed protein product [Gongylonema pulchrum]
MDLLRGNAVGWRISFLIAAGVDLTALITFALFAKGELQEWAKEEEPQQTMQDIVRRLSSMMRRMSSSQRSKTSSVRHQRLQEEDEEKCKKRTSRPTIDEEDEIPQSEQVNKFKQLLTNRF